MYTQVLFNQPTFPEVLLFGWFQKV